MVSILMAVYGGDSPKFLKESMDSLVNQSTKADEILIVKDGPLTSELEVLLAGYEGSAVRFLALPVNRGLAMALHEGLLACRGDLVARMDSDDICHPDRIKIQKQAFEGDPALAVLGTSILEFENTVHDAHSLRVLPESGEDLMRFAKRRSPVNHASVMYRKKAVLDSGNYQDFLWNEDYHLWSRMILRGYKFKNLRQALLFVRGGKAMYKRRGGLRYAMQDIKLQWYFYQIGFLNFYYFVTNILIRVPVRLLPNLLRKTIYERALRQASRAG